MSKKDRNPVKRMLIEERKWDMVHRDKKKYSRGSPDHHELDEEVEEAWQELVRQSQENGEYDE